MITITIPGEMRGKGRPRFSVRGGHARAYTDAKTANAETWIKACAVSQAGLKPLDTAVSLDMAITVEVPASWSRKKREKALAGEIWPTGKPDIDNSCKLVADALNGIVWKDDKQIVRLVASKRYGEVAQTVLVVSDAC